MDLRRNDGIERSLWEHCLCLESDFCLTQGRFLAQILGNWIFFQYNPWLRTKCLFYFFIFFIKGLFFVVSFNPSLLHFLLFPIGPRVGGLDLFKTTCTALPSLHSPNPPTYHFSLSSFRPLPHPLILSCVVLSTLTSGEGGKGGEARGKGIQVVGGCTFRNWKYIF